ncbi:LapA family protein [Acidobacteriota bacterium]
MKPKIIIILILIAMSILFVLQNTQVVEFQLLFWTFVMSRIIVISFMLLIGFVIGYLVARMEKGKKTKRY